MKNIVFCFDGTWNTSDSEFPTNVVKTAQMITPRNEEGHEQVIYYDPGVGSGQVPIAKGFDRILGGAFGVGLINNIEEAYRFLTFNYAPQDKIFVFGFSRGAFSARSFGGLIRSCGILRKDNVQQARNAVALYRSKRADPAAEPDAVRSTQVRLSPADEERYVKFREEFCVPAYVSAHDRDCRMKRSFGSPPEKLTIEYLGVWDTVGALGIPGHVLFANYFNKKYGFHDLNLSSLYNSGRHALSIDERRRTFDATPWANLDDLNREKMAETNSKTPPFQQQWFPGDHGSVGGGGNVNGHWQATLVWVVEGAQEHGLGIDNAQLEDYRGGILPSASVYCMKDWSFGVSSLSSRRWRKGPKAEEATAISDHALTRLRLKAEELPEHRPYRPKSLKQILAKLTAKN